MRKGLLAPQNTFLDTIAERFDGSRKFFGFWVGLGFGSGSQSVLRRVFFRNFWRKKSIVYEENFL